MANTRTIFSKLPDFYKKISDSDSLEAMNHLKLPPKTEKADFEIKWIGEPTIFEDYVPRPTV